QVCAFHWEVFVMAGAALSFSALQVSGMIEGHFAGVRREWNSRGHPGVAGGRRRQDRLLHRLVHLFDTVAGCAALRNRPLLIVLAYEIRIVAAGAPIMPH